MTGLVTGTVALVIILAAAPLHFWDRNLRVARAVGAIRSVAIRATIAGAIFSLPVAPIPGHAACSVSDMGDAAEAVYETGKDLFTGPCALMAPNPGFWALVGGFSAGTTSTPQLRDACNTIQEVAKTAGESKEKAQSALNKLPASVRQTLEQKLPVGAATEVINGVLGPLAWAACACQMANSAAIAKVYDVAGACTKDALCGLDAIVFGNSCEAAPQGIATVDCTKGVTGFGWVPVGGGLYVNKQGVSIQGKEVGYACACPPPMTFGTISFTNPTDYPGCYANGKVTTEGCRACVCRAPAKRVAMGVCICPDNSLALPNGDCPAPCKGSCPKGQILKRSVRLANGQCSSECACPPGQTMAGGNCQWPPCAAEGETRLPGGVCCTKDNVSACGECCLAGQVPDAATGQCVASQTPPAPTQTPPPPAQNQRVPEEGAPPVAKPDEAPKPILFRLPRQRAIAPSSPIIW